MTPTPTPRPEDLLTIKEACALLHVSRPTIYRYVSLGHLTIWKVGGSSRIDRNEIQGFIRKAVSA